MTLKGFTEPPYNSTLTTALTECSELTEMHTLYYCTSYLPKTKTEPFRVQERGVYEMAYDALVIYQRLLQAPPL